MPVGYTYMKFRQYISVILPLRLAWNPYYYSAEPLLVGDRVYVRFAGRSYLAVVYEAGVVPGITVEKISPVVSVAGNLSKISANELKLWKFVSDYYMCTIGEVYKAAYPELKIGSELSESRRKEAEIRRAARAEEVFQARVSRLKERALKKEAKIAATRPDTAAYRKLQAELLVIQGQLATLSGESPLSKDQKARSNYSVEINATEVPSLSSAQKEALKAIHEGFSVHKPVLLHGVTGSGKTEIYINLALEALAAGRNVLYLIPEIAVSRQLQDRLSKIFGSRLYGFHSKVSAAGRQAVASQVRNGAYVVFGTRSAIFLPHHDLGLIIVDEEQDTSYKQDTPPPRYNGRDTAIMLASMYGAGIVLGTATPSLESLYNCMTGKMVKVQLNERYFGSEDSDVEVIDTIAERRKHGMSGNFSYKLIERIHTALSAGGQVLVLRGRRAYSPAVQCTSCGDIPKCRSCNVPLSWHRQEGILTCHYCGWRVPYTGKCSKCGGDLVPLGSGTQRIEEEAKALFPDAVVARLDSDSALASGNDVSIIKDFAAGKIDILVGTQIIAKGFDFGSLSLVAMIQADSVLGQQDFRADERAAQLIAQFRGRSGRRDRRGLLVIQTLRPDHPVYRMFTENEDITADMMAERKEFGYPPYSRIVKVIFKDTDKIRVDSMSGDLAVLLKSGLPQDVSVLGPYAPVVDKISDHYIMNIRVSLPKTQHLSQTKETLGHIVDDFGQKYSYSGHIAIDVDPI